MVRVDRGRRGLALGIVAIVLIVSACSSYTLRRGAQKSTQAHKQRVSAMKITLGRRTLMLGTAMTIVVGGIALAILGAGGIVAWEYSNSNAFCSNNCHAVHPEVPRAYAAYSHARASASNATWAGCRRCSS